MKPEMEMKKKKKNSCQKRKNITEMFRKREGWEILQKEDMSRSMAPAILAGDAKQRLLPRGRVFCLTYPRIVDNR